VAVAKIVSDERRARRRQEQAAVREASRVAHEAEIDRAWANYITVRDWASRMRDTGATVALSDREQQIVAALTPLWDADRHTIGTLRRWMSPTSGGSVSDYEPASDTLSLRLRRELDIVRKQVGADLFVQESSVLGGFGTRRNDRLFNQDTVTFFKTMAALKDGGVLTPFRAATSRRIVWEIGGGWGGFAYQFKTLCPNVTYVITGLPIMLLVSAVYLMSAFPEARVHFSGEHGSGISWERWEEFDFIFAPESALPSVSPPRLDLALDIAALGAMDATRVESHVQRTFECGAGYIYSMMPANAPAAAATIWRQIERLYWPHPIPPRGPAGMKDPSRTDDDLDLVHLVGWRRLRV
jgi:putative sugar O-methyltransferase